MKINNEKEMKTMADFDDVIEKYHLALDEFVKGNSEPQKEIVFASR